MKTLNLIFHTDPGHGWLEVPKSMLVDLDISSQISSCSYMNTDYVYLEEDCDCTVFVKAAESNGYVLNVKEQHKEVTPIRNMMCFSN